MRVPLSWLREWVDVDASAETIAERLTLAGLTVDSLDRIGPDLSGVRVGFVRERDKHPNADRLSLCQVELGPDVNGGEPVEIVCGAPNVAAGQKVVVASPGAKLPDGRILERSKIRGVVSNGMICSARELGLGEEHDGILVLPADAPVGAPAAEVLRTGDVVLELELTPNRGDCASVLGVAREVRALFGGALRWPPCDVVEHGLPAERSLRIEIDDREGCFHYVGRIVRGVRVGASPDWLVRRLEAAGMRSIHNVVDVTNLVLLELGQPLHAFDLGALRGGLVRVRRAGAGERLVTLDGQERTLEPEDVVIADAERAIALAGVMGGLDTEVRAETTDVLIESARFAPSRIRRSARRTGLRSEASYRFERGVDPAGVRRAADRAARLLSELAGGTVDAGAIEVRGEAPVAPLAIELDPARVNRLLGTSLGAPEIAGLLEKLEIRSEPGEGGRLRCTPPSHRHDLAIREDLIEEVARLHGYDRIEPTLPEARLAPFREPVTRSLVDAARTSLVGAGLVEAVMLSFLDVGDLDRLDLSLDDRRRRTVRILNPVNEDESRLRTTLLPSLLRAARANLARRVPRVRLFEVARVFYSDGGSDEGLPDEPLRLAAVLVQGERASVWDPARPAPLFFEAKGVAERLLLELGVTPWFRAESGEPYLLPGASVQVGSGEHTLGAVGELHPDAAAAFELEAPCAVLELDLTTLALVPRMPARYTEISNQPPVRRDLALLLERDTAAGEVLEAIRKSAGSALASVDVFDRYEGKGVPEGRVSLAFRLVFQRSDRAFTDDEIARITDRVVQMLAHRFRAELR